MMAQIVSVRAYGLGISTAVGTWTTEMVLKYATCLKSSSKIGERQIHDMTLPYSIQVFVCSLVKAGRPAVTAK